MSVQAALGSGGGFGGGDKTLRRGLIETLKDAWADPDIRGRIKFVLMVFAVYALCVHVPVPIPGISPEKFEAAIADNAFFNLMNTFGGGSLKRISILALGLNPYITASIIMQIMTTAFPGLKKEMQEGGEYARRQQNRRIRALTIVLSIFQGLGLLQMMSSAIPAASQTVWIKATVVLFWTAGSMLLLYFGEQISERGIGNGVSLMIFAGIIISLPNMVGLVVNWVTIDPVRRIIPALLLTLLFLASTWLIVMFTSAQRRIPIQPMRRQVGMRTMAGSNSSYLPLSLNLAGVIPIIFAISLVYLPAQFASMFPVGSVPRDVLETIARFLSPDFRRIEGIIGCIFYTLLIFFFTYFYTAIQYNVEDMSNHLKRGGSLIPGVRPGKQTKDFLDAVISRLTIIGAFFLAIVALTQYFVPLIAPIQNLGLLFGTSLLIMVSVAMDTIRQIEANLLMKAYGQ